jgi:hypothetical protein
LDGCRKQLLISPSGPSSSREDAKRQRQLKRYRTYPRSAQTDSDEDTFTFAAADEYGPSSITDFEVIFSQFGSDSNGSGGPGNPNNPPQGGDCHFAYYPGSNTVYLDNQNGEYQWVANSVVGPAGTNITNGYCTVHAGSPNSQVSMGQRNLYLALDISFPSSTAHQHLYEFAYDQTNDLYSYGDTWYYWGWWLAP